VDDQKLQEQIGMMMLRVAGYKMGEVMSAMIHIGDRLGLYKTLRGLGVVTPADLAGKTGYQERWLREWMKGQAAAGILESQDGERFELTEAGAEVLANEEASLFFLGGMFAAPMEAQTINGAAEAFTTGIGLDYDAHGMGAVHRTERGFGPWTRLAFVPKIIPALEGVHDKLSAGADVVDVGCGAGLALVEMAKRYPASRFQGYDPSRNAIIRARENVAAAGLANVTLHQKMGEELPQKPSFDFVITFDCIHDMTRPSNTIAAIRKAIRDDGTWLIKDIRSSGSFADDRANPMLPMLYGFSVLSCLASGLSEPDGEGLGTLGFDAKTAERMCRAAGFTQFTIHDFGEAPNLYYEVRP
jgi:2-polyprenyl-3-methyl-5-hydroxy-6-metoxy-1,4-benzoquinol methylase